MRTSASAAGLDGSAVLGALSWRMDAGGERKAIGFCHFAAAQRGLNRERPRVARDMMVRMEGRVGEECRRRVSEKNVKGEEGECFGRVVFAAVDVDWCCSGTASDDREGRRNWERFAGCKKIPDHNKILPARGSLYPTFITVTPPHLLPITTCQLQHASCKR